MKFIRLKKYMVFALFSVKYMSEIISKTVLDN